MSSKKRGGGTKDSSAHKNSALRSHETGKTPNEQTGYTLGSPKRS